MLLVMIIQECVLYQYSKSHAYLYCYSYCIGSNDAEDPLPADNLLAAMSHLDALEKKQQHKMKKKQQSFGWQRQQQQQQDVHQQQQQHQRRSLEGEND